MRIHSRLAALIGTTALSITLTACGSSASSGSPSSASHPGSASASVAAIHNAADVSFVQNMIAHHQGAIEMAKLAATRASSQQVKDLATRIEAAQAPEITDMTSWLTAWGQSAGPTETSMPGMDHSSSPMSSGATSSGGAMGMMTDEQMNQLTSANGTEFDRMFLQMMTAHHRGAIDMARMERAEGTNPQAVALAKSIETSQTAEVTEMGRIRQNL
jgi:uncharacterized protein (DUF305 family)